jgi:hypothetical protein
VSLRVVLRDSDMNDTHWMGHDNKIQVSQSRIEHRRKPPLSGHDKMGEDGCKK